MGWGEEKEESHDTHKRKARAAWGAAAARSSFVLDSCCDHERADVKGFRDIEAGGAEPILSRAVAHEMTSSASELGHNEQSPGC